MHVVWEIKLKAALDSVKERKNPNRSTHTDKLSHSSHISLVFLSLSPHPPTPLSLPLFVFCIPGSFQCLKWRLLQLKCLCMCARACNSPISLLISLQSRRLAGGGEEGVAHAGGPGPGGWEEEEEWEGRGAGTADTYGWVPETGWKGWRWRKRGWVREGGEEIRGWCGVEEWAVLVLEHDTERRYRWRRGKAWSQRSTFTWLTSGLQRTS